MIAAYEPAIRAGALVFALCLAVSASPRAEEDRPAAEAASEDRAAGRDGRLKETEIRGELEKPEIFFILPKAQHDAETRERRIRFYPDILEPLDKDRFEEEARVLYQHGIPAE